MRSLDQLLNCFFFDLNRSSLEEAESIDRYDISIKGTPRPAIEETALSGALLAIGNVASAWRVRVYLKGQESPHTFTDANVKGWTEYIGDLQNDVRDTSIASVNVTLERHGLANIEVVNPTSLFKWIKALNGDAVFDVLKNICPSARPIQLIHSDFSPSFGSHLLCFTTAGKEAPDWLKDREKIVAQRRELIVSDWADLPYLAQDFRWTGPDGHLLQMWFARLENFMAVLSLADGSNRKDADHRNEGMRFAIRIRGHRLREQEIGWSELPTSPDLTLRQIDDWCYHTGGAGPLSDKLGLARNFVSLHWESQKAGIFGVSLRVVQAVRDGYQLYLKRNLKEYVELRSKVISSILELDGKAAKAVETAASNLERNFYGIVTVVVATVLARVMAGNAISDSMSPPLKGLGIFLCVISIIHALYARDAAMLELKRAKDVYADLKSQYSEFFEPSLIDSIFGEGKDSSMVKMDSYVRERVRKLMWIWATTVILFAVAILYFEGFIKIFQKFSDWLRASGAYQLPSKP